MIIAADARQVVHRLDAHLLEMRAGADAGEHQHLRRLHRAGAEDHLARAPITVAPSASFDAESRGRSRAARRTAWASVSSVHVGPASAGRSIALAVRLAPAVADQALAAAVALGVGAVEIGAGAELQRGQRVHERVVERGSGSARP